MLYQLSYAHHIAMLVPSCQMAHPAGLEPATIRLEGGCSIQLSYGRLFFASSMDAKIKALAERIELLFRRASYPATGGARQAGRIL